MIEIREDGTGYHAERLSLTQGWEHCGGQVVQVGYSTVRPRLHCSKCGQDVTEEPKLAATGSNENVTD